MPNNSLCVPRTEALEFVRFEGYGSSYPDWFHEIILFGYLNRSPDDETFMYSDKQGRVHLVEIGDVFLRNFKGEIMYLTVWQFSELFFEVE